MSQSKLSLWIWGNKSLTYNTPSFAGGLAAYLASGVSLSPEAVKMGIVYGSALASFCVTDFGTKALVDLEPNALKERLAAFKTLVHFDQNHS